MHGARDLSDEIKYKNFRVTLCNFQRVLRRDDSKKFEEL